MRSLFVIRSAVLAGAVLLSAAPGQAEDIAAVGAEVETAATTPRDACSVTVNLASTTGEPLSPGIRLVLHAGAELHRSDVDGAGAYAFDDLPCTAWVLDVQGRSNPLGRFRHAPSPQATWNVTLPPQHPLRVRVRDEDGRPVRTGAIAAGPRGSRVRWSVRPDSDGVVTYDFPEGPIAIDLGLEPLQVLSVQVDGRDRPVSSQVDMELRPGGVDVAVVVERARTFRLRIEDEDGQPVDGYRVVVAGPGGSRGMGYRPDADGWLGIDVAEFPVRATPRPTSPLWRTEPEEALVEGPGERVTFVARKEAGALQGRIVHAEDGTPVPGARIGLFPTPGHDCRYQSATADEDGRVEAHCFESCDLKVRLHWPEMKSTHLDAPGVASADCAGEHVFRIDPATEVRGRLRDREDAPLAHVEIDLGLRRATTDAEGRFTIPHVLPGEGRFRARLDDDLVLVRERVRRDGAVADAAVGEAAIEVEGGDRVVDVELRAVRGGRLCATIQPVDPGLPRHARISGIVAMRRGSTLERSFDMPAPAVQLDRRRICTGPLPPGDWIASVEGTFRPFWLPGVDSREEAIPVRVESGRTVETPAVAVRPAGRIEVRLVGWPVRRGIPESRPEFELARSESSRWTVHPPGRVRIAQLHSSPDPDRYGTLVYVLDHVPLGRWRLRVCDGPAGCAPDIPRIELDGRVELGERFLAEVEIVHPDVREFVKDPAP